MEQKFLLFTLVCFALSPFQTAIAQNHNIACNFQISAGNYDCIVNAVSVPDQEGLNFVFIGTHQPGQSHASVTRVMIQASLVPFVIRTAFTSFPNLRVYSFVNAVPHNVMRLQDNAFQGASNLFEITIAGASLSNLTVTSFQGAQNVRILDLQRNSLTSLPVGLVDPLVNLIGIDLSSNMLTDIHPNFFRSIPTLLGVNLANNQLTTLPGFLFLTNPLVNTILAQSNQISRIARTFLNGLTNLAELNLIGNICVSQTWNLPPGGNLDQIHAALQTCYDNYGPGSVAPRNYTMHLRGFLTLFREDGTLVGRL